MKKEITNKGIVQKDDAVLRKVSKEVPIELIGGRKINTIVSRMSKALENEEDGVAIAAPQIGESLRIFVVSKRIFEILEEERRIRNRTQLKVKDSQKKQKYNDLIFINPEILKTSKKLIELEEGCLSVRWLYGKVKRPEKTLVKAYDRDGKLFTLGGSGLLSQIFHHEIDHLNGILFIDKAKEVKNLPPKTRTKNKEL
jgi:peptide deformylase